MTANLSELQADAKYCPVCPEENGQQTFVEPEVDGEYQYWECPECGYAWGWHKVEGTRVEGSCAIGVPEAVRKAASLPAQRAQEILEGREKPVVQLGMPRLRNSEE